MRRYETEYSLCYCRRQGRLFEEVAGIVVSSRVQYGINRVYVCVLSDDWGCGRAHPSSSLLQLGFCAVIRSEKIQLK